MAETSTVKTYYGGEWQQILAASHFPLHQLRLNGTCWTRTAAVFAPSRVFRRLSTHLNPLRKVEIQPSNLLLEFLRLSSSLSRLALPHFFSPIKCLVMTLFLSSSLHYWDSRWVKNAMHCLAFCFLRFADGIMKVKKTCGIVVWPSF